MQPHFLTPGTYRPSQMPCARWLLLTSVVLVFAMSPCVTAQQQQSAAQQQPAAEFRDFVRQQAAALRGQDAAPGSLQEWKQRRQHLRDQLLQAWGGFPEHDAPLEPRLLGSLQRDGYRVEKIVFQTLPGVWMTANAYVPQVEGPRPAVLCVHGHWPGAKQDPHVQSRCIGLAKLGFFVLAVDALGAGERGLGKALGEYHGEMVGATLLPIGRPLSGLQVYENMRAVDYMISREEVQADRIGITGASGGGNQTMYAGAWDDRLRAVVPVCSVGNYQAYLGAACCMCEVVPAALTFTEESGVLALVAPRALLVISATQDAFQFSVAEAQKSIQGAQPVFELFDAPSRLRHDVFESPHDYNQPMREAMYGWMLLHLAGQGSGQPVPEPEMQTEEPELLRCFPGDSRPDDWLTLPQLAAREGHKLLSDWPAPPTTPQWNRLQEQLRQKLETDVLAGTTPKAVTIRSAERTPAYSAFRIEPEPGVVATVRQYHPQDAPIQNPNPPRVILLSFEDDSEPEIQALREAVVQSGRTVATLEFRATGRSAVNGDRIGRAPDHNSAEWSLWIGRPLLGQWVHDLRATLTVLSDQNEKTGHKGTTGDSVPAEPRQDHPGGVVIIARGPAGLVALGAAAVDDRVQQVITIGTMASLISDQPYLGQRLGTLAPGMLRDIGDIPQLAALMAPRRLSILAPVNAQAEPLNQQSAETAFQSTAQLFELSNAAANFHVTGSDTSDPDATAAVLKLLRE